MWVAKWICSLYPGLELTEWSLTRYAGLLAVVGVLVVVALGYVPLVVLTLWPWRRSHPVLATLALLLEHVLLLLLLWSYACAVLIDPGRITREWSFAALGWPLELRGSPEAAAAAQQLHVDDPTREMERGLVGKGHAVRFVPNQHIRLPAFVLMRNRSGRYRYCSKCLVYKPDRAHHCSTLGRCVLKMDHFCPWVNNTVGFYNHKFFFQFLVYALLTALTVGAGAPATLLQRLAQQPPDVTAATAALTIVGLVGWVVCLAIGCALLFFVSFHAYLLLKNRTTIEAYEVSDPAKAEAVEALDRGPLLNIVSVLGDRACTWLLPLWPGVDAVGDGIHWAYRRTGLAFV